MKKIKILLVILILFSFVLNSYAQKPKKEAKCKFDVEKKDEFTGADFKSVKVKMLVKQNLSTMMYNFEFTKNGDAYTLQVNYPLFGSIRDILPVGEELMIKLANGEVITLKTTTEIVPAVQFSGETVYSTYMIPFPVSKEELTKMSNSIPTTYKFPVGTLNVQNVLSEKDGQKLSNVSKCILQ